MDPANKRIVLGYPLDLLLNRECKFTDYIGSITESFISFTKKNEKDTNNLIGSIILPKEDDPGTGNIIIRGKPGTAKSTLAMQFAVSAAQEVNNCISFYITLEERPENILFKTKPFGWDSYCSIFNQLCGLDESASAEDYKEYLEKGMTQDVKNCRFHKKDKDYVNCQEHYKKEIEPQVFISTLTPRNIFNSDSKEFNLFWDRYGQLDRLLAAADAYNRPEKENTDKSNDDSKPKISFVIIDSVNVFGDGLLNRTELFRLFDLFKKYQIIGIFIVEEDEKYIFQHDNRLHGETLEYIGDVIISLTAEEDQNYAMRYFEITKSRYQHQVYGKHPFKITESFITSQMQKDFFQCKIPDKITCSQPENDDQKIPGQNYGIEIYKEDSKSFAFTTNSRNIFFQPKGFNKKQEFKYKLKVEKKVISVENVDNEKHDDKETITLRFDDKCKKYKISINDKENSFNKEECLIIKMPLPPVFAVKVFPSLHYIVYGTDISESGKINQNTGQYRDVFCDEGANHHLSKDHKKGSSLMIDGPRDSFKTSLARDFLMRGLFNNEEDVKNIPTYENPHEHVLFVRFLDYYTGGNKLKAFRISESCGNIVYIRSIEMAREDELKRDKELNNTFNEFILKDDKDKTPNPFWEPDKNIAYWEGMKLQNPSLQSTKRFLSTYGCRVHNKEKKFSELIYQSGYVFPEEFLQILLETIHTFGPKNVKRIVIDEIGRIGSSYPLLYKSKIAGDLFLTAVLHIIRNYNIKLLITGTSGEFSLADEVINKTKTLVDDVLTTKKINVFGDNYVTIHGGTLSSSESQHEIKNSDENVPGVIIPTEKFMFKVDNKKFVGLVGFDTNIIHRPGIELYFNEENSIHSDYNNEILLLLKYAFGQSIKTKSNLQKILLPELKRETTSVILDSLGILKDKPIENTVICALDEFFLAEKNKESVVLLKKSDQYALPDCNKDQYTLPYYNNVLVLAVNNSVIKNTELVGLRDSWQFNSWEDIEKNIQQVVDHPIRKFKVIDFCSEITETQSCIFLDVINSTYNDIFLNPDEDGKVDLSKYLSEKKEIKELDNSLTNNLFHLKKIFQFSPKTIEWIGQSNFDKAELGRLNLPDNKASFEVPKNLVPDSLFYICWYSELRHLIYNNPELASDIDIYSLPGKGFKGDWHLGILKGSVSEKLGRDVLDLLCDDKEDFKRFVRGVGLPSDRFNTNKKELNKEAKFLAWPGSKIDITLEKVLEIHKDAKKRSIISGYLDIRLVFSVLFKQLIMMKNIQEGEKDERSIKNEISRAIVNRLPFILKRLNLKNDNDK